MPPSLAADDTRSGSNPLLSARSFYLGLVAVSLIVAAASLATPSTPSYDPFAWLIWGREIIHLDLQTTGGPTWKPLPVIFTTIFALFGKIQPDLWLVVARAGAFAAVVMAFRLSIRLTRQIGSWFVKPAGDPGWLLEWLPGLAAGVMCVLGLALSGGYLSSNALGYSEGLALALILVALERHLDGHSRQAFALGFFVALDRPEIWLFWGPYGLWLFWRDPGARKLVLGLFVLIPILWFAPEYWGSGQFLRGADRAQHVRSNSLALTSCPFCSELKDAAWPTVLLRLKVAAAVLLIATAAIARGVARRTGARGLLTSDPRVRAQVVTALCALGGLAWFVVIAIMTQAHFSGNNRYLVFGSALIDICGAVAFGWAAQELANLIALGARRGRAVGGRLLASGAIAAGSAIAGIVFLEAPNWVGHTLIDIPATHGSIVYQGHLRDGVSRPRQALWRQGEGAHLRNGDDRGLPGPAGRVDARRQDAARPGPASGRHRSRHAARPQRHPADARLAQPVAAAARALVAEGALHLRRHERTLPDVHPLPESHRMIVMGKH